MEDTTTNYSTIIISVLMAVVIIATVMMPIITATTQTATTTEIDNEGAGWLKLGYNSGNDFDFEITNENSNISIGDQTGTMGDNIFYADSKNVIFADSVQNAIFLLDTESFSVHKFSNTVSVENTEGTLNISDGTETVVSSSSPTWAYVPDANGEYGFFTEGGLNLEEGKPTVAVGSYAGAFAYNNTVLGPGGVVLNLVMSGNYADGEVTWVIPSEVSPLTLDPISFEPSVIQPIDSGSVGLMSVPTPTYTDGVWGYELSNGVAKIVSYSGTPAPNENIIIPSTVGGYPADTVGKGGAFENVINSGLGGNDLVISEGIKIINQYALNGLGTMKGAVYLPSTLTNVNASSFSNDSGFYGLVNLSSATFHNSSFQNCTGIKEVLNLGGTNLTTTSYGLNADSVQDYVTALGYIAPVSIHNTIIVEDTSLSATLLKLLPVFMVLAVVIFIAYAMYRPDSEFIQSLKNKL